MTTRFPSIQRYRPTDATGWFWSLALILAGIFYSQFFPTVGIILLLAASVCFLWQFKKWHRDSAINRKATAWCRDHYPSYGGSPVVDFMVALAHDTGCDFTQLTPSTLLDDLNSLPEEEDDICRGTVHSNRHQVWIADLVRDSRVRNIDLSQFSGTTLHDAIQFVSVPRNVG